MASGHSKRGGGDRVLESRHLIGLFLGVVLLCCVFFTLGYVMGKTQYGNAPVEAASIDKTPQAVTPRGAQRAAPSQASPEWDFYARKKTAEVPLKPAPASSHVAESASAAAPPSFSPVATARAPISAPASGNVPAPAPVRLPESVRHKTAPPASRPSSAVPSRFRAPRISKNAVVLQVGALRSESDALAMADALQAKGFPSFVVNPTTDGFYRVQVGPFDSQAIGDKAKQNLQRAGFKAIYRR
ncbi:MAG TPA: SPOR domain-containing protein [Candidatus Acidoferrales bacterium]|nr:SPOR domain-containing protein [Candidatus Acidoferrales bacterium]